MGGIIPYNAVANGSRDFIVISGHFERGQVAKWRSGEVANKRRAGLANENDSKRRRFKNQD